MSILHWIISKWRRFNTGAEGFERYDTDLVVTVVYITILCLLTYVAVLWTGA
jgi:hypothetical protein